jgi:hypothetical protein
MFESKVEKRLATLGISPEKFKSFDVLVLPEAFHRKDGDCVEIETDDNVILAKLLQEKNVKCGTLHDLDVETKFIDRRGADVWGGFVWVMSNLAIPIVVSVLSNYIYDKLKKKDEPKRIVHMTLCIQRGRDQAVLDYDGPAEDFATILNSLANLKDGGDEQRSIR